MAKLKISYNAPVVLTFAIIATVVHGLSHIFGFWWQTWFVAWPEFHGARTYVGLVSHIFGHGNWDHLLSNFMMILLVGPILEERHGSRSLAAMIGITALITGLINVTFFSHPLLGASGIVFMMILLASTANFERGTVPLTFIAVTILFLGREAVSMFGDADGISHSAHLIGGFAGAAFGFLTAGKKTALPMPSTLPLVASKPGLPAKIPAPSPSSKLPQLR
ncbi:MAG: rhomboid family intramembrane serine protease [Kofleriaceae bacterium]|nr:rhomboid family intramembrane serine protease [Kofleriaceae bacterium]